MRKTWIFVAFIATFAKTLSASNAQIIQDYVDAYTQISIYESVRSGIPASIILGQGILESQYGTGKLARIANNHFGIKWTSTKDGAYVLQKDDDYDKKRRLIESKFIKYKSAEESYIHHTDFLMNRPNYKRLFTLDPTDYRRWAKGLSECGYATDTEYAKKLINIIETYNLQQFDTPSVLALDEADIAPQDNYHSIGRDNNIIDFIETKTDADNDVLFEISNESSPELVAKAAPTKLKTQKNNNKSTFNQLFEVITDDDSPRVVTKTVKKNTAKKAVKRGE